MDSWTTRWTWNWQLYQVLLACQYKNKVRRRTPSSLSLQVWEGQPNIWGDLTRKICPVWNGLKSFSTHVCFHGSCKQISVAIETSRKLLTFYFWSWDETVWVLYLRGFVDFSYITLNGHLEIQAKEGRTQPPWHRWVLSNESFSLDKKHFYKTKHILFCSPKSNI